MCPVERIAEKKKKKGGKKKGKKKRKGRPLENPPALIWIRNAGVKGKKKKVRGNVVPSVFSSLLP